MTPDSQRHSIVSEEGVWPLDGLEGKEVRLVSVELESGVHVPPHRHPGWQLIYVLDGPVVSQMEGEPSREYRTGEWWFEPREHLHVDIGNDQDSKAKILVFYVTEPGQPVTILEPSSGS